MPSSADSSRPLALALDLGGTQVRAGLVAGGDLIARAALGTDTVGGPQGVIAQFFALADEVLAAADRSISALGICAPGPLDSLTGEIIDIPTLPGWQNFPLRDVLARRFGLPVTLENDGLAAAFGEWRYGAGRGHDNLVYVTVSTGIGGGVIVDGHLLHGRRGMAGHVGHMQIGMDGPRCACGATGCFEAFASGTALGTRARLAAAEHPEGYLGEVARHERVEARRVVTGARSGDPVCVHLLNDEASWLGRGFTSLIHLFSPDLVIMGGGVAAGYDLMAPRIAATIADNAMPAFRDVPVAAAALGDSSGLVGVAALALETASKYAPS